MKHVMKHVMKHMQLPSGRQSGLPVVIDDDWSTEQVVAVAELLQDLLHVIHSRYPTATWTDQSYSDTLQASNILLRRV